jgi:hypothetical protein
VLEVYASVSKASSQGTIRPLSSSPSAASPASKAASKFCFISCTKQFLLYTSLDFVLYLVPGVERLDSIQVNDLTYLLGEIARQGQDIPFTFELSFSLLLQPWFQRLFGDGQLSGQPDDVERSIIEQFSWRAPASEPSGPSKIPKDAKAPNAIAPLPTFQAPPPLPSIKTSVPTKTLPHIPRVKSKELVQETSSAYKDLLPYLLSLTWDARRFNQPGEQAKLRQAVASWKRVQHLEAGEPVEWSTSALAQIFRGLNLNDWKFSEGMQLRVIVHAAAGDCNSSNISQELILLIAYSSNISQEFSSFVIKNLEIMRRIKVCCASIEGTLSRWKCGARNCCNHSILVSFPSLFI